MTCGPSLRGGSALVIASSNRPRKSNTRDPSASSVRHWLSESPAAANTGVTIDSPIKTPAIKLLACHVLLMACLMMAPTFGGDGTNVGFAQVKRNQRVSDLPVGVVPTEKRQKRRGRATSQARARKFFWGTL